MILPVDIGLVRSCPSIVGSSPRDCGPGGQYLWFIFIRWGIVHGGDLS